MIKDKFQKQFSGSLSKSGLCKSCRRSGPQRQKSPGCSLPRPQLCKTENLTSPLVFCMDCIFKKLPIGQSGTASHCDEIVFSGNKGEAWIYCIENKKGKSKNITLSGVQMQLQGGAKVVSARLSQKDKFEFLPVLATKQGVRSVYRRELEKFKIVCGGQNKRIYILSTRQDANLPVLPPPPLL